MSKSASGTSQSVLVLHGPNLNLLGTREPEVYGRESLEDINRRLTEAAGGAGVAVSCFQSNHEGELVDWIQQAGREGVAFIVINPAAYTHTSVALRDALAGVGIPFIEVHISNVHSRESFRHQSYVSLRADGVIVGCGVEGYELALRRVVSLLG